MTIGERIRILRKELNLNQTEFGNRIKYKQTAIGFWENGQRTVSDSAILLICSEFHVCEQWLRKGVGPIFEEKSSAVLENVREEYDADELDMQIISKYLRLSPANKQVIKNYILDVANSFAQTGSPETTAAGAEADDDAIDREVESYRRELEEEKYIQTSEASPLPGVDTVTIAGRKV